jgi:hypothetical protein
MIRPNITFLLEIHAIEFQVFQCHLPYFMALIHVDRNKSSIFYDERGEWHQHVTFHVYGEPPPV